MNKQDKCIQITYLVIQLVDYTKIYITNIYDDLKTYNLYKTALLVQLKNHLVNNNTRLKILNKRQLTKLSKRN